MTTGNAFERQVAQEIEREVGPPRAVDALAIVRAAKQPKPSWRDRSMFTTARLIAAGAMLTAAGLFVAAGQWTGRSEGGPPNVLASGEPSPSTSPAPSPGLAAWVHGTMTIVECCGAEEETFDADGNRLTLRGEVRTGTVDMDDSRLSGTYTFTSSEDNFPQADGSRSVDITWGELVIDNADGSWRGQWSGTWDAAKEGFALLVVYPLTGEGAYLGLSALLSPTGAAFPVTDVAGAIFPGALPPR